MENAENKDRYGKWSVLDRHGKSWLCQCDCGTVRLVSASDLKCGKSTKCRKCGNKAMISAAHAANRTHGMGESAEMRIWVDMRRRCYQPHRRDYRNYGARGIYVCDRWRDSFQAFLDDMGPRPEGMSLDRIDNDGPYSPENCRWVDAKTQGTNRRTNVRYDFFGEHLTITEASLRFGIKANSIRSRIHLHGWPPEKAVSVPVRGSKGPR